MRRFIKSRVIEWGLVSWLSYWIVAPFFVRQTVFTVINGVIMALWIGILLAYWRGTWVAVRNNRKSLGAKLVLTGIASLSLAITSIFTWGWFYEYAGRPSWMRDSLWRGWFSWIFLCGTVMLLVASTTDDTLLIPRDSWGRIGFVVAAAILIVVAIFLSIGGFQG
jgi:hypothetical protein